METEVLTYKQTDNYDPSHTTGLRNAFAANMKRRFNELVKVLITSVVTNDCFGLTPKPHTLQMNPAQQEAFAFVRSAEKVELFMKWLQEQVDRGILEVSVFQQIGSSVDAAWTNLYISDSYKRGVIRARYELKKAGYDVPTIDQTGGIGVVMMGPLHVDRLGLLFTRVFNDLKGITAAMDMQISRVLAQGIADGDGMRLLARKLVSTINGTKMGELGITDTLGRFIPAQRRALMLARTEMMRAFNESALVEFRNWGVLGINVKAEYSTAKDDRVCPICQPLEGKVFTLDEASGMLPKHPSCRCIFLPHIAEIQKYR